MKLNLGCGGRVKEGWVNIDLYHCADNVVPLDIRRLPFPDGSAGEICSAAALEHIGYRDVPATLREWHRVLCFGGKVTICVPDFEWIVKKWLAEEEGFRTARGQQLVYGLQLHEGEFHRSLYTPASLYRLMINTGFREVKVENYEASPEEYAGGQVMLVATGTK